MIPVSKKVIKQKKIAKARAIEMKKIQKKKNNSLLDQYENDDYNTNK